MRWLIAACAAAALPSAPLHAQPAAPLVRPIDPGPVALAPEHESAGITRFSFIAYGDTRGQADGSAPQIEHGRIVDAMIRAIRARASTPFPVRFVVQSGDAVTAGSSPAQWNVSFTPLIDRLIAEGGVPYFLAVGNHDVTTRPVDDPQRQPGLQNTLAAMSKLYPPDGSPRRLAGYPTFAFGYGNMFVLCLDSTIAGDRTQFEWATRQLEGLDRARFRHVTAVFHHPVISSGPHGGATLESQTAALRGLYMPLFRRHHVGLMIAGHEHLLEHWVERYADDAGRHRLDQLVTGGGGAPIYTYRREPDLADYLAAGAASNVSVEHLVKPGPTADSNPHHFVVVQVDGDILSLEVVSTAPMGFRPYRRRVFELADPAR